MSVVLTWTVIGNGERLNFDRLNVIFTHRRRRNSPFQSQQYSFCVIDVCK